MDEISITQQIEFIHDRLAELQQFTHEFPQTAEQQQHVQQLFQQLFTHLAKCNPAGKTNQQRSVTNLSTSRSDLEQQASNPAAELSPMSQQLADEILEHQRTTAALKASEAKLKAILESAVVAITSLRVFANQDWQFEYRSPGCEAIFGYSAEELIVDKRLWVSSVHPDDLKAVILPAFEDIFAERSTTLEYRFLHKSGEWRWIAETIFSQRDAAANCWMVTVVSTDIHDRKQAEASLRQQTEILQTIFDHVPVMMALFDADGSLTWVNREWETVLGWSVQDLPDNLLEEFYPDPTYRQYVVDFIHSADRHWEDFKTRKRDGHTIDTAWTNVKLSDGRTIGIGQDFTRRKQIEAALRRQAEQGQALNRVMQSIHNSLDLNTIFTTTVSEIGVLLHADTAGIMRYFPDRQTWLNVATYCQNSDYPNITGIEVLKENRHLTERLQHFEAVQINSIELLGDCSIALPETTSTIPGAWLLVPLRMGSTLWGCLSLVRSQLPTDWQAAEVELARMIVDQLAIAIQQSELYVQVQRLNAELERQVKVRTAQLQLAYESEATLKRITDRVRDSLDEDQILQTAVHELAQSLGATCCNAALFDLDADTSTIRYEYTQITTPARGRVSRMADFPEIYHQLLQGQHFQFCSLLPHPFRGRVAMLACPILDDQSVMGDLWVINQSFHAFSEPDIRLVQQVANQCAIALRQSRLYQTAQTQVQELEKLNHLKDDFLSTVSHELRSPMSSIKMAIQMLEVTLFSQNNEQPLSPAHQKASRYFKILHDECQREISLINNLLDLSRLEADTEPIAATPVHLATWLPQVVEPFRARTYSQQQQIILNLESDLSILTQPAHLERILTELLHNACKYTPAGEIITLSVQTIALNQTHNEAAKNGVASSFYSPIASDLYPSTMGWQDQSSCAIPRMTSGVSLAADQQSTPLLAIRISNSGVEIPETECDRIFDKFYRIPNNDPWRHGGTGLGLALVKKLVEHLGGTIKVLSENKKTTFVIHLPIQRSL
jgi:PAS domain S-box-containing protein